MPLNTLWSRTVILNNLLELALRQVCHNKDLLTLLPLRAINLYPPRIGVETRS